MFPCIQCNENFTRKSNLVRHTNEYHLNIPQKHYLQSHGTHINCSSHLPQVTENHITRFICNSAFNNSVRTIRFTSELHLLPEEFLYRTLPLIRATIDLLKRENHPLKLHCSLTVTFSKGQTTDESYFSVKTQPILILNIDDVILNLLTQIEQYTKRGSNWKLTKTNSFQINVSNYQCI